jgi:hypothetical protein
VQVRRRHLHVAIAPPGFTQHGRGSAGWTHFAVGSFLTGRWHPLNASSEALPTGMPLGRSFPAIMGSYGYNTVAFWGNTAPSQVDHLHEGFGGNVIDNAAGVTHGAKVLQWTGERPKEPFFAYVHEIDLHINHPPGQDAPSRVRADYDKVLSEYDRVVGVYIEKLRAAPLARDLVVMVMSDHGEDLYEHGGYGHCLLYDTILHVPLVVVDPRTPGQRAPTARVQTVDLAPTILARAGIPLDQTMVGQPLTPLLGGPGEFVERDLSASRMAKTCRSARIATSC